MIAIPRIETQSSLIASEARGSVGGLAEGHAIVADYFAWHQTLAGDRDSPGMFRREGLPQMSDDEAHAKIGQAGGLIESVLGLEKLETHARELVRPYLSAPRHERDALYVDLGNGPQQYNVAAGIPEDIRDLLEFLTAAHAVRRLVVSGDCQGLAVMAVMLGQIMARIDARQFEPLVTKAKSLQQRAVNAGKTRVLLTIEQRRDAAREIKTEPTIIVEMGGEVISQLPAAKEFKCGPDWSKELADLYDEAAKAYSAGAFTASSMVCRKVLMSCACDKKAPENKSFQEYVDYITGSVLTFPDAKAAIDKIRSIGNEANHHIASVNQADAQRSMKIVTYLLNTIYSLPSA